MICIVILSNHCFDLFEESVKYNHCETTFYTILTKELRKISIFVLIITSRAFISKSYTFV